MVVQNTGINDTDLDALAVDAHLVELGHAG